MAIKKIKLQNCDSCPSCGGKSGIEFTLKANIRCENYWGCDPKESVETGTKILNKSVKTAVCINCKKRFEIIQ